MFAMYNKNHTRIDIHLEPLCDTQHTFYTSMTQNNTADTVQSKLTTHGEKYRVITINLIDIHAHVNVSVLRQHILTLSAFL
mgnify:CR=1 FL=1